MEEKQQKQEKVNLIQKSTTYKLIIPSEVEAKIRFTCNKVWNVEWSGTLFYTYEGSFDDNSLIITARDIFVMDIGSSSYTEFDMSPSVISYMTEHPELLDCQMGLIHSHNNMATFFSGTDTNTLKEEGIDRNHFVSLIVNNVGKYTAAITRFVKSIRDIRESISYESFDDEHKESSRQYYDEIKQLESYKLEIVKEDITGFDELNSQLEEIKKNKASICSIAPYKIIDCQHKDTPLLNNTGYNFYGGPLDSPITSSKKAIQQEIPFTDLDETKMPNMEEESLHFKEDSIKYYALQLVTGSIVIPNSSNIDISKWIDSMPSVYQRRFGEDKEGKQLYAVWISQFVEFIIMYADDDLSILCDDEQLWSILAQDLITYFSQFKENEYLKVITDELFNFVV